MLNGVSGVLHVNRMGDHLSANPALRPSEYTAALIQALRQRRHAVEGADALEIGFGSGVVLAALGAMGAGALCGVDIEAEAVESGAALLRDLGLAEVSTLHRGDMWGPVAGRRFGLIVANLPHFPMPPAEYGGRRPSWSSGGADGRRYLEVFVSGLSEHLAPGGRALLTHNAFSGLATTRAQAESAGLAMRPALTTLVHITEDKLARMTATVLAREEGRTIFRYGPYVFGEMLVVEIARPGDLGADG